MRIINRDLTREVVHVYVTDDQIYAEIYCKSHGKWEHETYFVSYDFLVDEELVEIIIKHIVEKWGLKNPKIIIE